MTLSPETDLMMTAIRAAGGKAFHAGTVEEGRAAVDAFFALPNPAPPMAETTRHEVSVAGGRIAILRFVPQGLVVGRILFCHGGGWVCGTAEGHAAMASQLAQATGCVVAVPDYRRAPEHPFPVPVEDCAAALVWFAAQGAGPLFVAGDSAGGNIAAVLALRARDGGGPALTGQILIYPVVDTDTTRPSYIDPANQQILTTQDMVWFIDHYLPDPAQRRHPDAAPLHAETLSNLPPAFVAVAGHDPLRDAVEAYARRLTESGVTVEVVTFPGDVHGFLVLGGQLASAHRLMADIGAWVTATLA